ncbi:MAG: hypothetical protein QF590_00715 [Dehalococcoidia bacterium]|jgi:hypothetical protein|nr:hypothetical protein [Dehalococcoidia bacterium]
MQTRARNPLSTGVKRLAGEVRIGLDRKKTSVQASRTSFSFAEDLLGQTQPVQLDPAGLEYPGELILVAEREPRFGEPLDGVSMLRLVLTAFQRRPSSSAIPNLCCSSSTRPDGCHSETSSNVGDWNTVVLT